MLKQLTSASKEFNHQALELREADHAVTILINVLDHLFPVRFGSLGLNQWSHDLLELLG